MSNSYFKILLLTFWFLVSSGTNLFAIDNNAQDTLILDNGQIEIYKKEISKNRIENYRQQKDFNYDHSEVKVTGFFERIQMLISRWLSFISKSLGVIWYLRYFIIGGLIILLIYIITKSNASGLFRPHKKVMQMPFAENLNPESVNWEEEIRNALKMGEYRLAVRYHFLSALKSLSKNELITWKAEKTNYDYISEIKNSQVKSNFSELSKLYEAIWYGNFPIVQEEYASIGQDFEQFNSLFNTRIK